MKIHVAIFVILFLSFSACGKKRECVGTLDTFWSLSPIKNEYHIGDTISVSSIFSRYVDGYDLFGKDYLGKFDMVGIYWEPSSAIIRIDSTYNILKPYYSLFGVWAEPLIDTAYDYTIHHYTDVGYNLFGEYNYASDTFYLAYKFVFTHQGIYLLSNRYISDINNPFQYFPGLCKQEAQIEIRSILNEGHHNNAYLLYDSPDPYFNYIMANDLELKFYNRGMFCFKVVE